MKVIKFFILMFFNCFWYMHGYKISLVYADVGQEGPVGMSPTYRCVPHPIDVVAPYQEGSDNEEDITRNLKGLTDGISEYARIGDMPRRYQRHTVGVSNRILQLLSRVARAISCYHDHHAE